MSGKVFLDANILVYAQDAGSADKQRRSRDLITRLAATGDGVISTQVMQEFFVSVTRKLGVPPLAAKAILKTFTVFEIVTAGPELIHEAIDCAVLNAISFWDALILAAAASAGCGILCTEDLSPGQIIMGVKIQNPFA
ncbi:MAG TPA: PIN domain-containing protein [Thermoanaerobaculia bacterium]|nr:PIN domain-containing protein [Thermoanaerobaculia bacterium]